MELSLQKADFHLLRGCCLEAERADMVSVHLEGLRQALPETYGGHLAMLVEEMRSSARVLRDLADLSQMHFNRVPILLNYLNIVLPSTPSTQVGPVLRPELMILPTLQDPNAHWAEQIFSLPLPSRTALKHNRPSEARGQFVAWGQLNIPKETKMLFRRYVTHQSASPTWLQRKSNHRVWLKDVQLYVFCHRYRQQNQRKGQAGAFEINFVSDEGAKRFREVFAPAPEDTSEVSMEAIEDAK
ncbi:hypothetical protein COL154_012957 [Colletotrichum chrysophilum]|nr:hypothetical protein KNSL1_012689 [Colletotrichum chrysophilum]KAJ0351357.1 hypothetical protein COL154_012957 [Colletotrichum chrysophilum]